MQDGQVGCRLSDDAKQCDTRKENRLKFRNETRETLYSFKLSVTVNLKLTKKKLFHRLDYKTKLSATQKQQVLQMRRNFEIIRLSERITVFKKSVSHKKYLILSYQFFSTKFFRS